MRVGVGFVVNGGVFVVLVVVVVVVDILLFGGTRVERINYVGMLLALEVWVRVRAGGKG